MPDLSAAQGGGCQQSTAVKHAGRPLGRLGAPYTRHVCRRAIGRSELLTAQAMETVLHPEPQYDGRSSHPACR
jgi:hypothetical protein